METETRSAATTGPYQNFLFAMNSPVTKERYSTRLRSFFAYIGIEGTTTEARCRGFMEKVKENGVENGDYNHNNNGNWAYASVIKFLQYQKDRCDKKEITGSTVRGYYKAVKLFMEVNDILLPWSKIKHGLPKGRHYADDRIPTLEEIRKLVEYPDRRIKAIVYTMASSGIRLGAWDYLKWGHIKPIIQDGQIIAARITVYAGEDEQYYSYITPEALKTLQEWMNYRMQAGEQITPDSCVMRDLWDTGFPSGGGFATVPKRLKSSGVKRLMERALWAQGLRKKLTPGKRRHEFSSNHSFRKYFHTMCHSSGIKPVVAELLLGHSLGLGDSYLRFTQEEIMEEYIKALDNLTINDENRLKLQIDILTSKAQNTEQIIDAKIAEKDIEIRNMQQQIKTILAAISTSNNKVEVAGKLIQQSIHKPASEMNLVD